MSSVVQGAMEAGAASHQAAGSIDVSFIVAAFNVAEFIEAAVLSALAQQGVTVEVVVVDDASTDATAARVKAIAAGDTRVRLIEQPVNRGPSAARNAAIAVARGQWIAILDGDDTVLAERSQTLLDLASATSADIVADNFERTDVHGTPLGRYMLPGRPGAHAIAVDAAAYMRGNALFDANARLGAVKMMIRADVLRRTGIRYREDIVVGEDYFFGLDALLAGLKLVVSAAPLYRYRMRPGSVSWRIDRDHIDLLERLHRGFDLKDAPAELRAAAMHYESRLTAARGLTEAVALAKQGRLWRSLLAAAGSRGTLPILARAATAATLRRIIPARTSAHAEQS